ncbi:hypothetical protein, partial [Escherichia sp. 92.1228]|uniref:hypothetical protein n=1 Tax=Escherichia sp. 92.1228 TaxID=2723304 RepID=UPI001A92DFDB
PATNATRDKAPATLRLTGLFRLEADSTTVFLLRNPSLLHSVLCIPHNITGLQPLHFSYEKGRRVSPLRPG